MEIAPLIRALVTEMKELTIKAGVPEEKYQSILSVMEESTEMDCREIHTWLSDVRFNQYDHVLKVWERHEPTTWAMYELMEVWHLAEQKLLRKHFGGLCKAWKECPFIKRKRQ